MGNATRIWHAPQKLPKILFSMVKALVPFFLMLKRSGWQAEQSNSKLCSSWENMASLRGAEVPSFIGDLNFSGSCRIDDSVFKAFTGRILPALIASAQSMPLPKLAKG